MMTRSPCFLSTWCCCSTALAGCGGCRSTCWSKLPYEAKIELLEAENDLALAVDRLDEARAEVSRARDQIRRARTATRPRATR